MWTMSEMIKLCECGKVLTTKQAETTGLCDECGKKHAVDLYHNHSDFPPDVIEKLKENGY